MKYNRHDKGQSGFTLIELLVVIAIIAILAAILFPVFAKVREKARQAACASNEKQLGLAIIQYTEDYDEAYPSDTNDATGWSQATGSSFMWAIYPYVKSTQVYKCPDESSTYASSYDDNNNIYGSIASLVAPSSTVMLIEAARVGTPPTDQSQTENVYHGLNPSGPDDYTCYFFAGRVIGNGAPYHVDHNRSNLVYADGHVKISSPYTTTAGLNVAIPFGDPNTASTTMCTVALPACWLNQGVNTFPTAGPWG